MDPLDIIHAAQNSALNTYPEADAKEAIRASIDRAYRLAEVQLPASLEYQDMVENVTHKILYSYPYLTAQEVALVADAGVAGELGGRTRPSAAAFFGWLAAYVNSDTRKEAIRNYRRGNTHDPSASTLTRSEKDELNRQAEVRAINALWREFEKHGRILDDHLDGYVAMAMDGFQKRNIINITEENWKQARELAEKLYRRQQRIPFNAVLGFSPEFKTKRVMLEMCFRGLQNAHYHLKIDA